ncbi:hypothetical protein AKJ16_DCAP04906 [Drosera capensis]
MATTTTASLKIIAGAITAVIAATVAALLFPDLFVSVASVEIPDLRTWLRPPYLYFVLNCIILTIAASSRLHHNHHHNNPPPPPLNIDFSATDSDRGRSGNHNDNDYDQFWFGDCGDAVELKDVELEKESTAASTVVDKELIEVEGKDGGGEEDVVAGRMEWEGFGSESARGSAGSVVARRPTRSSLGGVNPRSHEETLETTWKSITQGPQVPPTPPPPRVRTEPSAGQEELNRKVEAFIERFNEEMRLQRQQSMQQFMEMINRAA